MLSETFEALHAACGLMIALPIGNRFAMKNRQAALISAASSLTDSSWGKSVTKGNVARRITDNARVFELWLDVCDRAEEAGRLPQSFDQILEFTTRYNYQRYENFFGSRVVDVVLNGYDLELTFYNGVRITHIDTASEKYDEIPTRGASDE